MSLPVQLEKSTSITRTTQLHAENALHLSENLGVRDSFATLIFSNDIRLLIDPGTELLLGEALRLAALTNSLADSWRNLRRRSNLIFAVQLRNALVVGALMAFVGTGGSCM